VGATLVTALASFAPLARKNRAHFAKDDCETRPDLRSENSIWLTPEHPFRVAQDKPKSFMAHVVTNKCVQCKFTDCVVVCPVACFYELEGQLVIHPEECIDCMACVDECPVHAIYAEADVPPEFQADIEANAVEARKVQESGQGAIETKKDPLPTAAARKAELGY
jgi:ferredoxin